MYFFIKSCKLEIFINMSELELMGCIIAAAAHDYKHPGYNNIYCINT